ncbi:MAG: hypothetical protein HQL38_08675 [Alphaproteobacteria bacterium]|nr:hypothetical protein [Alphaproteobacteria bacterium]MBF0392744.1 hypothetical protein [Alphaproteobacteria bacterium]
MFKLRIGIVDTGIDLNILTDLVDWTKVSQIVIWTFQEYESILKIDSLKKAVILPIDCLHLISGFETDFIIVSSTESNYELLSMGVSQDKIIDLAAFSGMFIQRTSRKYTYLHGVSAANCKFEVLVTGMSYAHSGYCPPTAALKTAKLCYSGQDLFNDFQLAKVFLNLPPFSAVQAAVVALSPYSFLYDMSLTSTGNHLNFFYYPVHRQLHNLKHADQIESLIGEGLIRFFQSMRPAAGTELDLHNNGELVLVSQIHVRSICDAKKSASRWANKNYPDTEKETRSILIDYINLLKQRGIVPFVTVFPMSEYFMRWFDRKTMDQFHAAINSVMLETSFEFVNLCESDAFDLDDFANIDHLNVRGAQKATALIEHRIKERLGLAS